MEMENQNNLFECGDFEFYKTLFDPVRSEILKFLAINGKKNITEIAKNFTQDRSVISRHLELMNRYKILNKEKLNRITFYEINSEYILEKFETTTNTLKEYIKNKVY
ncbi:bacterial regulatory protein, arsR family [Clostridium beijerinckii]|nr:helix-turn-helix transcriptional regulator [Clostridium beijerinckii]AQS05633.1 bacterial regulatory protein, arsR family [Clostridium beijerinckii]NRV19001.1 DNA-binding transcriptional ArsR family regulator [Clostridium beijerinckii]NRW61362.1 DNA-binding transcriptional ArsR family regulator [Clostridium beijerinckii]OOM24809.1 bacterial regulatory protein, arsR family [Clostridium beijerinckii]OOM35334.1 bacterial regulatory protein, arsR family [Clostridium beijerinckii]